MIDPLDIVSLFACFNICQIDFCSMSVTISDKSFGIGRPQVWLDLVTVVWFFDFLFDPFFLGFRLSLCCSQRRLVGPTWFSKGIHWRSMWRAVAPPFVGKKGFHWFLGSFFSDSQPKKVPYWRNRKARLFRNYSQLGTFWHRMRTASGPFLEPREIMLVLTLTSAEGRHKKSGKIGWQHLNIKWLNNWTYCESFEMFWQIWRIFRQRRP